MDPMDRLQTMKAFVRVVDHGGFTAAARALEVDQALVTRQVANLERHLGVKLLERTTRSMRLTEAGETFLARCRHILSDVAEAEAAASGSHQNMAGRVRLAVPSLLGMADIGQRFTRLYGGFPQITLDVAELDRPVDPVTEGFDVVITDASFGVSSQAVARPLRTLPFILCAAPAYLERHGAPAAPQDLSAHRCVAQWNTGEEGHALERWTVLSAAGGQESVDVRVAMRTNSFAATLEVVRSGLGIGRLTTSLLGDDLAAGRLAPVLSGWSAGRVALNLVYPAHRMMPRRVRHVIDNIMAQRHDPVPGEALLGLAL
jgi:DNA-binding transcriptional LysR family regulator